MLELLAGIIVVVIGLHLVAGLLMLIGSGVRR